MKFVKVSTAWFTERGRVGLLQKYGPEGLRVAVALVRGMSKRGDMKFAVDEIIKTLKITDSNSRAKARVKKLLEQFVEDELVTLEGELDQKGINLAWSVADVLYDEKTFIILQDDELDIILENSRNDSCLLSVFLCIKKHINNETKVAYPSTQTMAKQCGISHESRNVARAIKKLRKLGLIEYRNEGLIVKNGKLQQTNNVYAIKQHGRVSPLDRHFRKRDMTG